LNWNVKYLVLESVSECSLLKYCEIRSDGEPISCCSNTSPRLYLGCDFCKFISILNGGKSGNLLKSVSKCFGIGITYIEHDLADVLTGRFKEIFSGFYPYALDILDGGIIGGFLKSSFKGSTTYMD